MIQWPTKLIQFMERPVPKFSHIAAVTHGMPPVNCRGYGYHVDIENGLAVVYLLRSQWLKLNEYLQKQKWLAVLITAGTDNESYQLKGLFSECRPLSHKDRLGIERQGKLIAEFFPHLLQVVAVDPANCLAVSFEVKEVYLQTPGPQAGILLTERSQ